MANAIASGWGTSQINGEWVETGTYNSVPYYVKDGRYLYKQIGQGYFVSSTSIPWDEVNLYYYNNDTSMSFPWSSSTGYIEYQGSSPIGTFVSAGSSSQSPSLSPSASVSPSLSPSASQSPSLSPSTSQSPSLSPSSSVSPSLSPSASLSPSSSVSPSLSPSASLSPSSSASPSLSPSASESPSLSPSASESPSLSPSSSISPSMSPSMSPSLSPSAGYTRRRFIRH